MPAKAEQQKCVTVTPRRSRPDETKYQAAFHDPMARRDVRDCHAKDTTKKAPPSARTAQEGKRLAFVVA